MKVKEYLESLTILVCLGLGTLDTLNYLPPYLDFIDKLIAYILLIWLWYELDITELLFGYRNKKLDIVLIIIYYILASHVLTEIVSTGKDKYFLEWIIYNFAKKFMFNQTSLTLSYILLHFVPLVIIKKIDLRGFSLLSSIAYYLNLGEIISKKSILSHITRYIISYFLIITFYSVIFEKIMQWTVSTIDKSLLVIGIIYVFHFSEKISASSIAKEIDDIEKKMTRHGLRLFTTPENFKYGMAGLFILFMLSEIGFFIIPYLTGSFDVFYKIQHDTILRIASKDLSRPNLTVSEKIFIYIGHILSFTGLILLMTIPAMLYLFSMGIYKKKNILKHPIIVTFILALFMSFFIIGNVDFSVSKEKNVLGVNLTIFPLLYIGNITELMLKIVLINFIMVILFLVAYFFVVEDIYLFTTVLIAFLFLGSYLYNFLTSQINGYAIIYKWFFNNAYDAVRYIHTADNTYPKILAIIQFIESLLLGKLWLEITITTLFYFTGYTACIYTVYEWVTTEFMFSRFIIKKFMIFLITLTIVIFSSAKTYLMALFLIYSMIFYVDWKKSGRIIRDINYYGLAFFSSMFIFLAIMQSIIHLFGQNISAHSIIIISDSIVFILLLYIFKKDLKYFTIFSWNYLILSIVIGVILGYYGILLGESLPIKYFPGFIISTIFLISVALFEETAFRHALYSMFSNLEGDKFFTISVYFLQAYIFSIIHFIRGFITINQFLYLLIFSFVMIMMRRQTATIIYPAISHIITNYMILLYNFNFIHI